MYQGIWPESKHGGPGAIPEEPYEVDPDWYEYQTSGQGEPSDAYNPDDAYGHGYIAYNPASYPGVRYHFIRQQKYLANLFL